MFAFYLRDQRDDFTLDNLYLERTSLGVIISNIGPITS